MAASFTRVALSGTTSSVAFDGVTSDGVIHFIPPERKQPLPLFAAFERGHPPFEYERPGLKDPDVLTFSHHQHLALQGVKLGCADCHKPAADGIFYQRVTYEAACERCHTLQFDPANPQLTIPHGDVARLRSFLHSLPYQYEELDRKMEAAQNKSAPPEEQKAFADQQIVALLGRAHIQSPGDLEQEILFTADPYKDRPPTGQRPFFSGCAYCHQVSQPAGGGDPVVTPPLMADRWLAHGAFTHAKHVFMSCEQCHNATDSRQASDIIMPSQASCISCHHTDGAAPSNCLACHTFHSPQTVVSAIKAKWPLPQTAADCPAMGRMSSFLISEQRPKE
jgi:mono/diheme cytochrome c family protein